MQAVILIILNPMTWILIGLVFLYYYIGSFNPFSWLEDLLNLGECYTDEKTIEDQDATRYWSGDTEAEGTSLLYQINNGKNPNIDSYGFKVYDKTLANGVCCNDTHSCSDYSCQYCVGHGQTDDSEEDNGSRMMNHHFSFNGGLDAGQNAYEKNMGGACKTNRRCGGYFDNDIMGRVNGESVNSESVNSKSVSCFSKRKATHEERCNKHDKEGCQGDRDCFWFDKEATGYCLGSVITGNGPNVQECDEGFKSVFDLNCEPGLQRCVKGANKDENGKVNDPNWKL